MSYKIIKKDEIKDLLQLSNYSLYKLCYIDKISETVMDYDEASKAYMSRPDYSWEKEKARYGYYSPNLSMMEYPNPEYDPEESSHYAYFTPIPLKDQWGDDWSDSPYEHNAGYPYDDCGNFGEYEIIKIPFGIKSTRVWVKFPDDYGGGNSPFSVEDINFGAVAWVYAIGSHKGVSIHGGDTIEMFLNKLNEIENL